MSNLIFLKDDNHQINHPELLFSLFVYIIIIIIIQYKAILLFLTIKHCIFLYIHAEERELIWNIVWLRTVIKELNGKWASLLKDSKDMKTTFARFSDNIVCLVPLFPLFFIGFRAPSLSPQYSFINGYSVNYTFNFNV